MNTNDWQTLQRSIGLHLLVGALAFALLVGGIGGWAAATEIVGAVIAPGSIVVESSLKKVQHPVGGVVSELLVRDGDRVAAGDVVMRLDATMTKANLQIVLKSLDQFAARRARLESEGNRSGRVLFPDNLLARGAEPDIAAMMTAEQRLYESRSDVRESKKKQLDHRVKQLHDEIRGMEAEQAASERERFLIKDELDRYLPLYDKGLMEKSRLSALQRQATDVDGEIGRLTANIAGVREKMAETALQVIQVDEQWTEEVGSDLREMDARIGEYAERKIAAEDQLKRVDIIAPQSGIVHQLAVHTVGGVIAPGEPVMMIVPGVDKLVVEAKVQPQDIDQIFSGQRAILRFSAFSQKTTPEIVGAIERVSADVTIDEKTGVSYYTARIAITAAEMERLGAVKLMPGMPVETFITTGERSVASYFIKPFMDQVNRAFREG